MIFGLATHFIKAVFGFWILNLRRGLWRKGKRSGICEVSLLDFSFLFAYIVFPFTNPATTQMQTQPLPFLLISVFKLHLEFLF